MTGLGDFMDYFNQEQARAASPSRRCWIVFPYCSLGLINVHLVVIIVHLAVIIVHLDFEFITTCVHNKVNNNTAK